MFPALGSSNGGVRVTISGRGFLGFSTLLTLGRCRWGLGAHTTALLSLTDEQIVCASARREDLRTGGNATHYVASTSSEEELFVALNAVDYSSTGYPFAFFSESIGNVSVGEGPAGGPSTGGTLTTVLGAGLEDVKYCKFGNGTASRVDGVCTYDSCVCVSTAIGDGTAPDGATFHDGPRKELSAGVGDGINPAVVHPRGFVPILLSRDGNNWFHTAQVFFYYPVPANFSSIYPGGGPDDAPTSVTLAGQGMKGFNGEASNCRCRWGGLEASADITTPISVSPSELVCMSFDRQEQGPGEVELYVSLNAGVDFHPTGQVFAFYTQPVVVRTGCLGAVKGCLTTGPTSGENPMKVTGIRFNVFVDYESARCRFLYRGGVYYNRIATIADGDFLGTGLKNGSITADGTSLYCICLLYTSPSPRDS